MYKLPYYTEPDQDKVLNFMEANHFALIIGVNKNLAYSTHVPLEIKKENGKIILSGHVMKETDHYKAFESNGEVLVIFTGPHCYISAAWYSQKKVASTWNYMEVHARGKICFTDEAGTLSIVKVLTQKMEPPHSLAAFDQLPNEYIARLLPYIAGFTIEVGKLDTVFKLSQDKDEPSRERIIENLKNSPHHFETVIAAEMEKRLKPTNE